VYFGVALAAIAAAAVVVVGAALPGGEPAKTSSGPASAARKGPPPLELELGVRNDPDARLLRHAAAVYGAGRRRQALALFDRSRSLEAQVGAAFAGWPTGTLERLRALARAHPQSGLVLVDLGIVRAWRGDVAGARREWRLAKRLQPDSPYALRADTFLHPGYVPGVPVFVPSFAARATVSNPTALRALRDAAAQGGVRQNLVYGIVLQQLGHQLSAERAYGQAAALAPNDPDARVAAAVGRFDKDHPERAFSRLGPLVRVFPHASTVRFHLGLLLAWLAQVDAAKQQFRKAYALAPSSSLGREARRFLQRLVGTRTK
jgi:Flp pilus assembly protein TadD